MAGVPALRSTVTRVPAIGAGVNAAKGSVAADASIAGATSARAIEPVAATVTARPRDQSAVLLLTLALDGAQEPAARNGFGTGGAERQADRCYTAEACRTYRRQGAEPEFYSEAPIIFRFHI
ncbi:hypothetical protein [Algihabitans albus]|uniref:hypothetical protein n=1 Tax=Algihabitans albus TaxID=2164067 RepID=UPI000E5D1EF0|nr:hypothetical protein [Algihabitans albus]